MKVIAITGTRRDKRKGEVRAYLAEQCPDVVIVGDAPGVDAEAVSWAKNRVLLIVCYAPWRAPGKATTPKAGGAGSRTPYWPGAGNFRDGAIARALHSYQRDGNHVRLAAFPDDESRGTWDCVEQCDAAVDFPGDPKWRAMAEAKGLWP